MELAATGQDGIKVQHSIYLSLSLSLSMDRPKAHEYLTAASSMTCEGYMRYRHNYIMHDITDSIYICHLHSTDCPIAPAHSRI